MIRWLAPDAASAPIALAPVLTLALALVLGACVPPPAGRATAVPTADRPAITPTAPPAATPAGPTPVPSFRRPTPTPRPTFFAYLVHTGDTLTSIAREFGTTRESIAYWNRARYPSLDPESPAYAPDVIRVGWTLLLIPGGEIDPEDLPLGPISTSGTSATADPSATPTG